MFLIVQVNRQFPLEQLIDGTFKFTPEKFIDGFTFDSADIKFVLKSFMGSTPCSCLVAQSLVKFELPFSIDVEIHRHAFTQNILDYQNIKRIQYLIS